MSVLVTFLSIMVAVAMADSWFCTEGTSRRLGSVYQVCGVANSDSEQQSRQDALGAAYREFDALCDRDDSCKGFQTQIDPKRSECKKKENQFECRRMIEIKIMEKRKLIVENPARLLSEPSPDSPVVFVGQTQQSLIEAIGMPDQVISAAADGSDRTKILFFRSRSICDQGSCSVVVTDDVVERYSGINPKFSDVLVKKKTKGFWAEVKRVFGL